jgi:hypothetical protein
MSMSLICGLDADKMSVEFVSRVTLQTSAVASCAVMGLRLE